MRATATIVAGLPDERRHAVIHALTSQFEAMVDETRDPTGKAILAAEH